MNNKEKPQGRQIRNVDGKQGNPKKNVPHYRIKTPEGPNTSTEEPQQNKKDKKVCPYFLKGNCRHGESCRSLHPEGGSEPPKVVAKKSPKPTQTYQSNGEKKVCKYDLVGSCSRGSDCKYLHAPQSPSKKTNPEPKPSKSNAKRSFEQELVRPKRTKSVPVATVGVTLLLDAFECIDKELHDRLLSEDLTEWPIVDEISAKTVAAVLLRYNQLQDLQPLISYITGLTVDKEAVILHLNDNKEAQGVLSQLGLEMTPPFDYYQTKQSFLVLVKYEKRYEMSNVMVYNPVLYTSHLRFIRHQASNLTKREAFHLAKLPTIKSLGGFTGLSTSLFDRELGLPYFRSHYRAAVLFIDGDRAVFARKRYTDLFLEEAFLPLRMLVRNNRNGEEKQLKATQQFERWLKTAQENPSLMPRYVVEELEGDSDGFKTSMTIGKRPELRRFTNYDLIHSQVAEMKKVVELGVERGVTWAEAEWRIIGGTVYNNSILNPASMVETIHEEIHEEGNISMEESRKLIDENTPYYDVLIDGFEVARVFVAPLPDVLSNNFMGIEGERGLLTYAEFKKTMGEFDEMFLSYLEQFVDENPLLKSFLNP